MTVLSSILTVENLLPPMLAAAEQLIGKEWPALKQDIIPSLESIAHSIAEIGEEHIAQDIDAAEAKLDMDMAKNSAKSTLLTAAGLTELAAKSAIEAALNAVKNEVNAKLGFVLL